MQKRGGFVSRQDTAPKKGVSYRESCPHLPSLTPGAASQQGLGITPGPCPAGAGPSTQGIRSRARINGEGKGFMAEGYQRHNIKTRQKEKKERRKRKEKTSLSLPRIIPQAEEMWDHHLSQTLSKTHPYTKGAALAAHSLI